MNSLFWKQVGDNVNSLSDSLSKMYASRKEDEFNQNIAQAMQPKPVQVERPVQTPSVQPTPNFSGMIGRDVPTNALPAGAMNPNIPQAPLFSPTQTENVKPSPMEAFRNVVQSRPDLLGTRSAQEKLKAMQLFAPQTKYVQSGTMAVKTNPLTDEMEGKPEEIGTKKVKPSYQTVIAPEGAKDIDGNDVGGKTVRSAYNPETQSNDIIGLVPEKQDKTRPTKAVTIINSDGTPKKDKNGNPVSKLIYTDDGTDVPNSAIYSKSAGGFSSLANMHIDPQAQENFYQQWLTDGTIPRIPGMGGALATVQLMNDFGKRAEKEGYSGQAIAAQRAVYKTAQSGLQKVTNLSSTLAPSVEAAKKNMDVVENQLDKYKDKLTQSPLANEYKQWINGGRLTGDPEYTKYKIAIYTAVREYSKVTSGSSGSVTGLSDFATKGAEEILNTMQTPEAARAAIKQMKIDMGNIKTSWDSQQKTLRDNMKAQAPKNTQAVANTDQSQGSQNPSPAQIAPEDQEAIDWAKSNPNDPRAQKILQLHGIK